MNNFLKIFLSTCVAVALIFTGVLLVVFSAPGNEVASPNEMSSKTLINLSNLSVSEASASASMPDAHCLDDYKDLSKSYGKAYDSPWSILFANTHEYGEIAGDVHFNDFIDMNGDGLIDYLYYYNDDNTSRQCLYLNNGNGWDATYRCYYKNSDRTYFGDCAVQKYTGQPTIELQECRDFDGQSSSVFKPNAAWSTNFMVYDAGNYDKNEYNRFIDVNADGLVDFVYSHHYYDGESRNTYIRDCVYLNTGSGWKPIYRCYGNKSDNYYKGDCAAL